ncbi:MAG: thioredoxin-disulfide reductase [Candidatus Omnitrophica bacterium]|nr:thioredoxin-disulfide reductase [Candidatus Omnitrophota bacterium]MDD5355633.1 thioredoxin-disulfide reductase [Candidatus Omnitrophota bacterium]
MYDIIIIGAGPAGLTAAIYCGRSKLRTKIIEKAQPGGQVNLTEKVENFPGVFMADSKKISEVMIKQAKELESVEIDEFKDVKSVNCKDGIIEIKGSSDISGKDFSHQCKALILACGAQPKKLGLKGESEFTGKGVSYCAICDAPFFKDKDIVVIGGGDAALEEALYLAKFAKSIKLIHRRDQLRASGILQDRIKNNPKMELVLSSIPLEISGKNFVEKISVKNVKTGKESEINCSGVFIFVGYAPNTKFLEGFLTLDSDNYIITDEEMATEKQGIFACGDCRKRPFRQIVTACGEGAVAAHSAEKYLTNNNR